MDDDGTPKHRLYAVYMAHYPDDDTTELLKPQLEIFRDNREPVYIQAETGWVTSGDEVIFLLGDVRMWERDSDGNYKMEVDTSDVRILINDEYAETDRYATITTNSSIITGTGMRAYFPDSRLEVIKHDKTTIQTTPKI
jgi:lipopolysaccharide export system protein LptC